VKIAIVGSPKYAALWKVQKYIERLPAETVILIAGETPVDATVRAAARARNLGLKALRISPATHHSHVDFVRYTTMAKECERVVAFWDAKSKGVFDAIRKAVEYGRTVEINPEDSGDGTP
jgi:hypothetical protein